MKRFTDLIQQISTAHHQLQKQAANAVNQMLTIRNWLIGYYIVEYEQNGEDRARYGARLLSELAQNLQVKGLTAPELSRCIQFYYRYP